MKVVHRTRSKVKKPERERERKIERERMKHLGGEWNIVSL